MKARVKALSAIAAVVALALFSVVVFAAPQGPATIKSGADERRGVADTTGGVAEQAQAGNMTSLKINSTKITTRWQGYYGNITGTITLDDAANNTMYSWVIASPQGEVYAVNHSTTPTWANVKCLNFSAGAEQNISLANLNSGIGITDNADRESFNRTFNLTYQGGFSVGSNPAITTTDGCSLVSLYVNDNYDQADFNVTLLHQNQSKDMTIYAAILEQQATGFSGATLDFQMIVGENGDITGATDYYFYVELS